MRPISSVLLLIFSAGNALAQDKVSCPDGEHLKIDVNQIAIHYSGEGFAATLKGLSKLVGAEVQVSAKQLQEATAATQQWNQFIQGLVVGYNSCAVTRQQYADSLNRVYPKLQEDGANLESIRKLIAQGQTADARQLAGLIDSFYSSLRQFVQASGKEEILRNIEDLSQQVDTGNRKIIEGQEDLRRQQQIDADILLAKMERICRRISFIPSVEAQRHRHRRATRHGTIQIRAISGCK